MDNDIRTNFNTIASVRIFDERNKHLPISERANMLGISLTSYIYYLDKWCSIICHASQRAVEILRSQYASLINQSLPNMENKEETKRQRATKYESDVLCAQCFHSYLMGQNAKIKEFWYYVERHNELYGNDPHYTAIFNGNNERVNTLITARGHDAYKPAP